MAKRNILFLFGRQVCVPEDPLIAAKQMGLRTSVLAPEGPCCTTPSLIDHFEKVASYRPDEIVRLSNKINEITQIQAAVAYDDQGVPLAARVCEALGLRGNPVQAADATRSKLRMKQHFAAAGVPIAAYTLAGDEDDAVAWAEKRGYPVVVKPTCGSASQGVIRANNEEELRQAARRLLRIVSDYGLDDDAEARTSFLVESYMPGSEVSVELLVKDGTPHVLCVFEKPKMLEGPFFEETIYVTPARLREDVNSAVRELAVQASNAIGLRSGPAHCEIRLTPQGPRVLEIAGRLIGGACSRVFQHTLGVDIHIPVLKCALGEPFTMPVQVPRRAAGALMLPIPGEGTLKAINGLQAAEQLPGVRDVIVTAQPGQMIVPFPEQSCYVGFVTAVGETAQEVEQTLNSASQVISLELTPVECQMWECSIDPTSANLHSPVSEIEDLSVQPVSRARQIVREMLARAQFAELPAHAAATEAANCLEALESGRFGETSTDYWLVAKNRGVILGAHRDSSGFIACLAVIPQFRRDGVGGGLVGSLMSRFAARGETVMQVIVDPRDSAALATYRKLGFVPADAPKQVCCCS
jgi:biotin carboxylase/ribosomal protein S18 acetylase RimI-like enzyme